MMIPVSADTAGGNLSLVVSSSNVKIGDEFTVTVNYSAADGYAFIGGSIKFLPETTQYELVNVEAGEPFTTETAKDPTIGEDTESGKLLGTYVQSYTVKKLTDMDALSQSGTFCTYTFKALAEGNVTIKPENVASNLVTFQLRTSMKAADKKKVSTGTEVEGVAVNIASSEPTKYTVTFDTAGGSAVASQEVVEGGFATVPENPTKDGYTFKGWDKDITTTAITGPTTFTAQWEKIPVPPVFNGTSDRTNVTGKDGKEYSNIFVGNYSITPNDKTWTGCKFYPDTVGFDGTKGDLTFKSGFSFEGAGTITFKTAIVGVPEGVGIIIEPVYAD